MGDFRKKYPADWFQGKNNLARNYLGKNFSDEKKKSLMAYNAGKKNLTPLYVREKNSISRGLGEKNSYTNQITLTWVQAQF